MRLSQTDASSKSRTLVETIVNKIEGLSKPRRHFIISVFILYLSMRGRYTFKGMERYGEYCEKTYRLHFETDFDFLRFNIALSQASLSSHLIIAFDPSYLPKSGKQTPNIDKFWSGCLGKAVKGIEIGGLGVVDVDNHTALSLESIQTPNHRELQIRGQSLVNHYAQIIIDRKDQLSAISSYIAVDGYFTKISFVDPIIDQTQLHLVSKLRKDANLKYLYEGPQKKGRGRLKKYDGKIQLDKIEKRRFKRVYQDQDLILYQAIVWSVGLNRKINLAYAEFLDKGQPTKRYALFYSTDLELNGYLIYRYYKARFQIEFLFRDAKQYMGLSQCQCRSESKLYFHFNTSLTAVGVAKAVHYLTQEKNQRKSFSLASIKNLYFNELMLNLFLSNFQIDPNLQKNRAIYEKIIHYGRIAS
jgi:hypothetical protein